MFVAVSFFFYYFIYYFHDKTRINNQVGKMMVQLKEILEAWFPKLRDEVNYFCCLLELPQTFLIFSECIFT